MICRNAFALFALVQLGRSARWSPTKAMLRARPLAKSAALRGGGLVDWGSGSAANAKPRDADATGTSEELYEAYNLLHRLARDFKKVRAAQSFFRDGPKKDGVSDTTMVTLRSIESRAHALRGQ